MTTTHLLPQRHEVRKARAADVTRIATVLARAFFNDPSCTWWIPDDLRRRATLPPFFHLHTETFLVHDEVYVDADLIGAVVWGPPANPVGIQNIDEFGRRTQQIVAEVDMPRAFELATLFEERHPTQPHYYLQWAGVLPEAQGRGIGSALLAPVLRRCDQDAMPAYLVATSPRNRKLYERHGFTSFNEFAPADGPPFWSMWREPMPR